MKFLIVVLVAVIGIRGSLARVYTRCELAKARLAQGMPRAKLPDWVCLVESESSRNTAAKGDRNNDVVGSYDFGLFQINSRYWCKIGSVGGDCSANCNSFLDDNITDDSKCAQIIFKIHGFRAWDGWKAKCQGNLPNLSACGV